MYDQSFSEFTLLRMLRKSDFRDHSDLYDETHRNNYIRVAAHAAHTDFQGLNPLQAFVSNGKAIYQVTDLPSKLILRKITFNIQRKTGVRQPDRQSIVANLKLLLTEGVPFRIYRLDIRSFYESFVTSDVIKVINGISGLSPQTKRLTEWLLNVYQSSGGAGVPRGLALSAVLSEMMMWGFDNFVRGIQGVYFYARYVDDIIIITSALENETTFLKKLKGRLPVGLKFNESKQRIQCVKDRVAPVKVPGGGAILSFSYLGYSFDVFEPQRINDLHSLKHFRDVLVNISKDKRARYKTRICRSLREFSKTHDFDLLHDRLRFLTSNFSVRDLNTGKRRLAGIYYNYPHISSESSSLLELEKFLRDSIRSSHGRVFSLSSVALSASHKRMLLKLSFVRGHKECTFTHFHASRIRQIQGCWAHG
ncbi:phage-related reverse transcriptase/maturase family protein [Burkholderia pseudomallei]|uniref:antiviral reverse transcriptase Drt3a n=1 Tax=Burkholderia pseudomallei TaxID=28450 RepID=UPI0009B5553B|nr:antiviral reverse transcriptase Drt3a [Burkholderia pseudomallei]VBT18335.1 phage-related reverse transcriptase/maturase family protein [Burkholderia pseudomallei]